MKRNAAAINESNALLIIFYRNPEIGKVKTRLAATLGDSSALAIYLYIAAHTKLITENLPLDKAVFYSRHIDTEDNWKNGVYKKYVQTGTDLGERMSDAFSKGFRSGYESICIIGTDCYDLTSEIIEEAFVRLQTHDVVVGPDADGGYYLLGMKKHYQAFFADKPWSTHLVCEATLKDIKTLGLKYFMLPKLTDVDDESDLPQELQRLI